MRKSPHINQLVSCQKCPLTYCLKCQPEGCKCGCKSFIMDHSDIKGKGSINGDIYTTEEPSEVYGFNPEGIRQLWTDQMRLSSIIGGGGTGAEPSTYRIVDEAIRTSQNLGLRNSRGEHTYEYRRAAQALTPGQIMTSSDFPQSILGPNDVF